MVMLRTVMGSTIAVIYAHPYPNRSRTGRLLLSSVSGLEKVTVRSLYERYPDFSIDVEAEQNVLREAALIVWQHPVYWYGTPPLLSLWFEKVLARGWAYGKGGDALRDKACLWVPTTGGDADAYREGGMHGHAFEKFIPPVEQTARFCGMRWLPPLIVHGSHHATEDQLRERGLEYKQLLRPFLERSDSASALSAGADA
jgi:glutathione-regulated potassium-efflux system ancillary protein KefF